MKKLVLVINGRGGVGKDTLCNFAAERYVVRNISSITPVKALAAQCGWTGGKSDRDRRFLSDLKALLVAYNDNPTVWVMGEYRSFLESAEQILFVHIREGEEIRKFVEATGGRARTLLVRGGNRMPARPAYGNNSDDLVEAYHYDYCYVNDRPLEEARVSFLTLLSEIYASVRE